MLSNAKYIKYSFLIDHDGYDWYMDFILNPTQKAARITPDGLFTSFHYFSVLRVQFTGCTPCASRNSFAFRKCPFPKNPRFADRGLGCGDSSTR